jgi:hypothetical protein
MNDEQELSLSMPTGNFSDRTKTTLGRKKSVGAASEVRVWRACHADRLKIAPS